LLVNLEQGFGLQRGGQAQASDNDKYLLDIHGIFHLLCIPQRARYGWEIQVVL
jgi:hypothetical protein